MTIPHGDVLPAGAAPSSGFRDPGTLTRSLKLFLYLGIALGALSLASQLLELQLLNDMQAGRSPAPGAEASNDLRQQVIAGLRVVNFVVVIVLFCIWIYRANYNARQLGAADMQFSPGWAVGWYFIPIANLWKPYQAMREIWQASANPALWQHQPRGSILPLWWTFFLLSNFLGNASFRLSLRANTLPDLIVAGAVQAANDVADIVSTAIALVLVTQIFRMQMARRAADAFA
jgi:uncharacterized protein DUF4328